MSANHLSQDNFTYPIIEWFHEHGRHDLPWQHPRTPYRVWISEIMLQQTQVATVIPYFERFMQQYPNIDALAQANIDTLLSLWAGLGYYRRAHHIHQAARNIHTDHQGQLPNTFEALKALAGIGPSTAGAILSLGFDIPAVLLDGNVKRVLARVLDFPHPPSESRHHKSLWHIAQTLLPSHDAAAYAQALMDLGATVCTKSAPQCERCPVRTICQAKINGTIALRPKGGKRTKKRSIHTHILLLQDSTGALLLEKQDAQGLFPGLWHAPLTQEPATWCQQHQITQAPDIQTLPKIQHQLSHIDYQFQPVAIHLRQRPKNLPSGFAWHAPSAFATLGVPRWMQSCFKLLKDSIP